MSCPDCGTPPPPYAIPPGSRQPLTAAQHRTYLNTAKTPVDLTLDTSLNFDELLEAWRRAYKGEDPALDQDGGVPRSAPVQP